MVEMVRFTDPDDVDDEELGGIDEIDDDGDTESENEYFAEQEMARAMQMLRHQR